MKRFPIVLAALIVTVPLLGCPVASDSPPSDQQDAFSEQQTLDSSADDSSSQIPTLDSDSPAQSAVPVTDGDGPSGNAGNGNNDDDIPPEVLAALLQDSDKDGRTDWDELAQGTDPHDPTDGPDIDGDGVPNGSDPDVDGDGIPNAYDDDVDGDGLLNKSDPDIDGDGKNNDVDDDADGDGVENKKDNDDDADGEPDQEDKDEDECDSDVDCKEGEQCKDGDCAPFDLLALSLRLFDDAEQQGKDPDLIAHGREAVKEEASKPGDFDFEDAIQEFFMKAEAEAADKEKAMKEAMDFLGSIFDEDRDGVPDFNDPDHDGNGIKDASEAGKGSVGE